jgi:hypothetical protein
MLAATNSKNISQFEGMNSITVGSLCVSGGAGVEFQEA